MKSNRGPHKCRNFRGQHFSGTVTLPKDRPLSLYAPHHGPLAPIPLLFSFTVLLPICWIEDLNKAFVFRKLAAATGERRRRGVLGLNWRTLASYDQAHGNMCLASRSSLSHSTHTHTHTHTHNTHTSLFLSSSSSFFLAKVSRGKTPS